MEFDQSPDAGNNGAAQDQEAEKQSEGKQSSGKKSDGNQTKAANEYVNELIERASSADQLSAGKRDTIQAESNPKVESPPEALTPPIAGE